MHFLGAPPPEAFPGATAGEARVADHPTNARAARRAVRNCHRNFFPLGYALENFDPLGRWRTRDQAGPVDASGAFVDGTPTNGVVELRQVLLQRPDAFRTTITEKLLVYAAAGTVAAFQRNARDADPGSTDSARDANPRWSDLIAAVVRTKLPATE